MKSDNSLGKHMRIAALQCDFEGGLAGTMKVPALWQKFGFDTEQLFHTHGELYSAVFDVKRHGAKLKKYLAESRKRGIKTILYLNCHILLASQNKHAADWALVDRSGEYTKLYGTYYGCCLNSAWVDYFMGVIDSLAPFEIAGVFFDGPVSAPCFCRRCRKLFRASHGVDMSKATPTALTQFGRSAEQEFLRRAYARVKQVNPAWLVYNNMGVMHSGGADNIRALLACNDIVGTEGGFQFYGPPAQTDIWRCGLQARVVEAVAGDRPRVIFMAGDHKPWSWYLHTPAETRLCYASAIANGASVWYGIHSSSDLLQSSTGAAAREMVQFDRRNAAYYADTESAAETAIFHSFETAANYTASGEESDLYDSAGKKRDNAAGDYMAGLNGAVGALFRTGIPFDIVTELNIEQLKRYRALVLPNIACMSTNTGRRLREFVQAGGLLLADGETSLFDEQGKKRRDFLLRDLFGARFRGYRRYQTHDYFSLSKPLDTFKAEGVDLLPAPTLALDVAAAKDCVRGRLCPPLAGRYSGRPEAPKYPFITERKVGRGRVIFIAGLFFEFYKKFGITHYDRLIGRILNAHAKPPVELIGGNGAIEITTRRCAGKSGQLIHLVNYNGGMTRPIQQVAELRDLELRVRDGVRQARSLTTGRKLAISRNGTIKIPRLREFEVVWTE